MKRLAYILALIVVLTGIVHILIVLLVPSYAAKDAWAKLETVGEPWKFSTVSQPGGTGSILPLVDPSFGVAACRYDLSEAPLIVTAGGSLPFWSVAIFDRQGQNIYSFNDRTAVERQLFLIVVDPVQMAQLRKNPPEETERAVLVESTVKQGFVLIRALQEDESWSPIVQKFLQDAECERFVIEEQGDESNEN